MGLENDRLTLGTLSSTLFAISIISKKWKTHLKKECKIYFNLVITVQLVGDVYLV